MRCLLSSLLLVLFVVSSASSESVAEAKIRVLVTYGGHGFQAEPFFALFEGMDDVEFTKAELPKEANLLKPGLEKRFDTIVMYDMVKKFTPEQQKNFQALLKTGIGVFSMHHNMGAHRDWPEFTKIIDGKFIFGPCEIDGEKYKNSTWSHGENVNVSIADKKHPITRGLKDFTIHDETYGGYYTSKDVTVLLKTDHPKNEPELAWVSKYESSPVFYLMLGHDAHAFKNPSFIKLVHRGIQWTAGRLKD